MRKNKNYSHTAERITGDALLYFTLHNLISVLFFFLFTVRLNIYESKDISVSFLFTLEFWDLVIFQIMLFSIISSIIGRITAFVLMRAYFKYGAKKSMKRWTELNTGINRFSLLIFLFTTFITSIFYSLGLIAVLQDKIFDENSLLTLILTYIIFKVGVFLVVRYFIGAKT